MRSWRRFIGYEECVMDDPRLLGTLERIAHALEAQTKLQRQALIRLGWLVEKPAETEDD